VADAFAQGQPNVLNVQPNTQPADAVPYFKYTLPQKKFRGVVMTVHGGGWKATGPEAANHPYVLQQAREVRKAGYASLNITYTPGQAGRKDIVNFYHMARRLAHGHAVCGWGSSAGAYWVLTLGANLDCAIAEGVPVNLNKLNGKVKPWALDAFAPGLNEDQATQTLKKWSPSEHANSITARCLIGSAVNDELIGPDQAHELDGIPRVKVKFLGPGYGTFTHADPTKGQGVDREQLKQFRLAERRLLISTARQVDAKRQASAK
jgi:hypothetical protein